MASALAPRAIQRMEPSLIETVDHLLDNLPQHADIIEDFASTIPIQIIGEHQIAVPALYLCGNAVAVIILGASESDGGIEVTGIKESGKFQKDMNYQKADL